MSRCVKIFLFILHWNNCTKSIFRYFAQISLSRLRLRNRQPDQRAKKWAEINYGSNLGHCRRSSRHWHRKKMSRDQLRLKSRIRFITMNCSELLWITVRWNTVNEKLLLNLSHVFNDLMICSVAGFRQSSTPRHDAVKLFVWGRFAPRRKNQHQIREIAKHIQTVSLGCFDHAHKEDTRICTLIRRRKEKILTVDHKRLHGAFCKIICHFHFGMI